MIELNLPRDEKGRYILPVEDFSEIESDGFKNFYESPRFKSWIKTDDNKLVLLKYRNEEFVPLYMSDIIAEMIFCDFAKANGIRSANVDVGCVFGKDILMSENVSSESDPVFTYYRIISSLYEPDFDYTVDGIMGVIQKFADKNGFRIDENMRLDLLKMALVDYLVFQQDRHYDNIAFIMKGDKVTLSPSFDNEKSFLIDRIAVFLQSLDIIDDSVYNKSLTVEGEEDEKVAGCFDDVRNSTKIFNTPFLCIKSHNGSETVDELYDPEPVDPYNEYRSNNLIMTLDALDFAEEMKKDERLKNFYDKLDFEIFDIVKRREEKGGIKLPKIYVRFAEDIIKKQKSRIDRALASVMEEDDDEDNTLL